MKTNLYSSLCVDNIYYVFHVPFVYINNFVNDSYELYICMRLYICNYQNI